MSTQTTFTKLNDGWNAEPNAPDPSVRIDARDVVLEFTANAFQFAGFGQDQRLRLRFKNATSYRLGPTNDEGWYRGQCRFSMLAPAWGDFYEIAGDLKLDAAPNDWQEIAAGRAARHFLFYLRDETFECAASDWTLER
jgi:hypothetical protein